MTAAVDEERDAIEMPTIDRRSADGTVVARVKLDPSIFGVTPHVPVMHQVVVAQLAARRSGTQSTKTRSEVRGGSAKPFRQKGTGRARQGSIRAPHWSGGGVALGPKPRSYKQRTPKKMVQLALRGALSDRASSGRVCLVDEWGFGLPKTRDAVAALRALRLDGRILVVLAREDVMAERSFDNLQHVDLVENTQLTAYDVLCSDWVVFTNATVPGEVTVVEVVDRPAASSAADADAEAEADAEAGAGDAAGVAEPHGSAAARDADDDSEDDELPADGGPDRASEKTESEEDEA